MRLPASLLALVLALNAAPSPAVLNAVPSPSNPAAVPALPRSTRT